MTRTDCTIDRQLSSRTGKWIAGGHMHMNTYIHLYIPIHMHTHTGKKISESL